MGSSNGESRKDTIGRTIRITAENEADFWALVDQDQADDCWIWKGSVEKRYGVFRIGRDKLYAHRIAWVLEHNLPLASYEQVRRNCKEKRCVRPSHARRIRRSYQKHLESTRNSKFTVLKPPESGASGAQKNNTIQALTSATSEIRTLRESLRGFLNDRMVHHGEIVKNQKNLITSVTNLSVTLDQLNSDFFYWREAVNRRLEAIEAAAQDLKVRGFYAIHPPTPTRTETSVNGQNAPTSTFKLSLADPPDREQPPPAEEDAKSKPDANNQESGSRNADVELTPLHRTLMSAFQEGLGVPDSPSTEDHQALELVFELALSETGRDAATAVRLFGAWLDAFRRVTAQHPAMDRSPDRFAREVSARRL